MSESESLKTLNRREQEEVLDLAIDLYSADVSQKESDAKALIATAREMGVPPEYLERAAEQLRMRRAAAMVEAQQRRRLLVRSAGIAAAVVGIVAAAWFFLVPGPVTPFAETFDGGASRWTLDTSEGTQAAVRFETRGERGEVAVIAVERFAPAADGTFRANLDSLAAPADLSRHENVSISVRGEGLETARLYIEGDGVRWRSPPIRAGSEWNTHTIPLRSFEKQVRKGDAWSVVPWDAPEGVRRLSVKVGQYMNPPDASGHVEVDDIRIQ
jgi:hypothetical protein